ncbi:hypothetical protein ACFFMN_39145 [Planobispora siamensis]|uniref:Uncharacterized protein n=1 Tax=Planobispora siamensis TaxID=936338 RepID=A0A8J3SPI0_9ACTN|nr:hypothetical protein [Planobispora siamensis]GIH96321.1 hypothetical protein Psi01_69510 [Planobispora siamensis]
MTAAWVAGTTRARGLVRRRLGPEGARRIAAAGSGEAAVAALAATPYGHDVRAGHSPAEARHAVLATLLWHLRVLAGWLPREGGGDLRLLARWFEIANVDELLTPPVDAGPEFALGALSTAWPRLRGLSAPAEIRSVLGTSAWGDPGGDLPRQIQLGMRLSWAVTVADRIDPAAPLAAGAAALLVARERHLQGRDLTGGARRRAEALLGEPALAAGSLPATAAVLPAGARWALEGLDRPEDLWLGEVRWWRRLEREGFSHLSDSRFGPAAVLGALAVLTADARRARAAVELAVRGGRGDDVA